MACSGLIKKLRLAPPRFQAIDERLASTRQIDQDRRKVTGEAGCDPTWASRQRHVMGCCRARLGHAAAQQ
jgi:hypothetical protein